MSGKTEEHIKKERHHLIEVAEKAFEEKFEVIDSIIKDVPGNANDLWYLGESLKLMSQADVIIFSENWKNFRGCRIEHQAALDYKVADIIESYSKD